MGNICKRNSLALAQAMNPEHCSHYLIETNCFLAQV